MEPRTPKFSPAKSTSVTPSPKKVVSMLAHTPPHQQNAGIQVSPTMNVYSVAAARVLSRPEAFMATSTNASTNVSAITTTAPVSIVRDPPPLLPSTGYNVPLITTVATPMPVVNSPNIRPSGIPKAGILKNKGSPVAVNTSASATASNSYAENSRQLQIIRNQQQQITDFQKQMIEMQHHLMELNSRWKSNETTRVDVEYLKVKVKALSETTHKKTLENFQQELQTAIDHLKEAYNLIPNLQLLLESAILALNELAKREA